MTYSSAQVKPGSNDCLCTMTNPGSKWGSLFRIAIFQADPLNPSGRCVLCINAIYIGCGSICTIKESAYNTKIVADHGTMTLYHGNRIFATMGLFPSSSELSK